MACATTTAVAGTHYTRLLTEVLVLRQANSTMQQQMDGVVAELAAVGGLPPLTAGRAILLMHA